MKLSAFTCAVGAAMAAPLTSTLTMQSQLGSKLKMGGAVINGYCESDMSPEFVGAYSETGVVNGGVVNEVTVVLKNVKTTCVDNVGTAPCATDAGKDRWPAFVCSFTAAGVTTTAAPVQGLRVEDVSQSGQVMGIGAFVKCEMPARENADHDVTVSLAYHGKTVVAVPFTGKTGADIVSISSTASPTDSPTLYPTAAPTLSPTAEPTGTSGCSTVVNLASYYRDCSASSTKPSQFFTAHLEAGYEGTCGHAQFTFCNRRAAVDRTELRTFSCANSRAGIKGVTFGGTRFAFYTYFGAAANNAPIRKIMEPGQGNRQYLTFETDHQGSGNAWLEWDFTEPVVVTKVHWTWSPLSTGGEMSSRSGGVAVTGSNGGTGMVGSGAEQQRDVDWGNDCVDCPKGGAIKFSAIDGNLGDSPGSWSVQDIEVWGCTKSDSKHIDGWDHGDSNMRNGVCPSGYQDEDGDLVCARCTTAGDCGPGSEFDDSHCSTAKDNTCTSCEKPERSKFGNRDGTLSSGSCSFVCTDGFTGDQCQFSNVCADTTVVLGDAHGDGWNGAEAHIDAYTGFDQWTFVTTATWLDGAETHQDNANDEVKSVKSIGCLKDGCYAFHFENVGSFPREVFVLGSDGLTYRNHTIISKAQLESTNQKFWFAVNGGSASKVDKASCDAPGINRIQYVQLGDEHTVAPGTAVEFNHGELAGTDHS